MASLSSQNATYKTYLRYILCVNTIDRISYVLLRRHDQREGEHAGGGDAVVQPEHPAVDVHVRHVQQAPEFSEYFQHGSPVSESR